ncbi:DUF803-domain-containing protein [Meira miltonrushii]|uniref:DUF803-domain-containing protein n=1 Tax=Meira miltonrushii TaxID=1280837 RepID=A0A316VQQ9_9BASI|nr:DUF803-domain-containing protein [Meira miltonrushii]PWN37835.1 DUF803-domain-containing protein [Meira miltonrushii]
MTSGRNSLIGVAISLAGNVLISLALNCQKLAHTRMQREAQGLDPNFLSDEEEESESQPLQKSSRSPSSSGRGQDVGYGSTSSLPKPTNANNSPPKSRQMSRSSSVSAGSGKRKSTSESDGENNEPNRKEVNTEFLRSRLWWLGLGLMSLGEFGNFLSYAYAPASLVAPLGAVALLSNVIIAPILLKERFRPSDLGGILLAIIGAVTVVFSSKQSDATLNPDELLKAVLRPEFLAYTGIVIVFVIALAYVSSTSLGDRYILLDLGVCALLGGFTVLSTKGLSSLLSLGKPWQLVKVPITYGLLIVLIGTALAQITYLNRALQRFDSREVIPTQFVMFTISAIVGSAILYREFDNMEAHRLINFFFGCLTTFAGVYILTRAKNEEGNGHESDEEALEDEEEGEVDVREDSASRRTSSDAFTKPVAVPRTHPAAANNARRGKRRLRSKRSIVGFSAGSVPTVAIHRAPNAFLSTSLQETGSVPVAIARRSIFNPAFTIAYLDQSLPSTPRRIRPSGPASERPT